MDAERIFDFLEGRWDAVCRVPSKEGWEFGPGTLAASRTLDGLVSLELFEGIYHGGALKGLGLRAFNRETGEWEHTWTDTLSPGHFHVWKGGFSDGKVELFSDWTEADGRTVRSRLTWSDIREDRAHWESARSSDAGRTWQIHWVIDFHRRRRPSAAPTSVLRRTTMRETSDSPRAAVEMLARLNQEYVDAFLHADVGWYRAHLADDFVCIESDGSLLGKAEFLRVAEGGPDVASYELQNVRVRLFGDLALVHATGRFARSDGSAGTSRYTDVWALHDGTWRAIAAQITRAQEPPK